MNLVNELIKDLLPEEENKKTTALYAGGFKPPTSGHFEVVQQALKENPEIDEFIIFIGAKERDGISQDESLLIWEIYNNYLPFKVKLEPTSKPPIRAIYDYAKNHPTQEVLWVIGAREGNEEDFKDITSRTSSISKYPNLELRTIVTAGGVSGTAARNAAKVSFEKFEKFVPDVLSPEEKQEAYNLVSGKIQEVGEANVSPYKWKETKKTSYSLSYEFTTDSGVDYLVKFTDNDDDEDISSLEQIRDWDISFFSKSKTDSDGAYAYSSSQVVNKGELFKVMSTIVDITKDVIKNFPNTEKLSFQPSPSKGDDTVDNQRGRLYKAFISKQLPQSKVDQEGSTVTITLPEKISLNEIKYTNPNFDKEWEEAERYPEFVEMGKEEWVKLAKQGKSVPYSSIKKVLGNVNLDFDSLEEPKKQRFTLAFKDGNIETPIAVKFSDNDYDLVAGNTRLAGSVKNGVDPKIWVVDLSKQTLNENASYSQHIDVKQRIKELTKHMLNKGMNIQPLPKVIFKHGDAENAKQFLGKTAYYDPNNQSIVLYTEGRHPKDIVRSYAHEMIHHIQNLEGRLGNINTTNTLEDDHLDKLEQEANLGGTMTFRNWTDSLTEGKKKDPFGLNAYAAELARLREDKENIKVYLDMDGVLADFNQRFKDLSGMEPNEFESKYGKNEFWDFIDEKHKVGFWVGIPVMNGAKQLVDWASKHDYSILTAPSLKKQSILGKSLWVKKHTGDLFPSKPNVIFKQAKNKHLVKPELQKTDILIDDKQSTIDNWNAAGGTGIFYKNISQVLNDLGKLGL